ncbi:hypothetical protein EPN95_04150 [Patescibacteria group bacterium]|nr:MAG: hypothetical protein EPN95_04150 [Patescibacteria group bacterium]
MAQRELISPKYQKRLIFVIVFVLLLQLIGSFIFMAQNEFLRYASDGLLQSTIIADIYPVILFALAFLATSKKATRLWRMIQAICWAFAGTLLYLLLAIGSYFFTYNSYGTPLTYIYIPIIATTVLYVIGLLIWARANDITRGFQKVFVGMAALYLLIELVFVAISVYLYHGTLDYVSYIIYSITPIVLAAVMATVGYRYLRPIKSRLSRLFLSALAIVIAIYIGSGANAFDNALQNTTWIQNTLTIVADIIAIIVYIQLIRVIKKELLRKV